MKIKTLVALAVACSFTASAHKIKIDQTLPLVEVKNYGEILVKGDDISYQEWSSQDMLGKVRVIQAIAGRSSSKALNQPLMAAITDSKFTQDSYQTTSIINQDDAIWGTGSFVKSSAEDSKKDFPWSSMVLDEDGKVAGAWDLQEESSAIIVQDKQGKVLFVKEGALNQSEIEQVLALIKDNI
ncbi:YtfJ family protein [Vibrio sp. Of14-4]|uniref:YtfJ family protein n=1 Tax=Vibrio sp. Of14-4 TaxID=2724878 RepID=UPI001EF2AA8B|nr:YtfJ family protein [Vibrio sp. Of14-4]MCG7491499.1 YtfJ family protein [Vibrio sp. Of14-4]